MPNNLIRFMGLFKSKNNVEKYFFCDATDFSPRLRLLRVLNSQCCDLDSFNWAKKIFPCLECTINGSKIVKMVDPDPFSPKKIEVSIKLPLKSWPEHSLFFLVKNSKGKHRMGGACPKDFHPPRPFSYIGTIDCSDKYFSWLGLDKLHLVYPLRDFFWSMFLDYSNPNKPKIIGPKEVFKAEELPGIKLKKKRYSSVKKISTSKYRNTYDETIVCGIPLWEQDIETPLCPKTNKFMRFVCRINDDSDLVFQPLVAGDNLMNVGYGGHLSIFYSPDSKILAIIGQCS